MNNNNSLLSLLYAKYRENAYVYIQDVCHKLNQSEGEKRRGRMRVKEEEEKLRRRIIEDIEREKGGGKGHFTFLIVFIMEYFCVSMKLSSITLIAILTSSSITKSLKCILA